MLSAKPNKPLVERPKMLACMAFFDFVMPAVILLIIRLFFPLAHVHLQNEARLIPAIACALNLLANAIAIKNLKSETYFMYAMFWSLTMMFTPTAIFVVYNNHEICDMLLETDHAILNTIMAVVSTAIFHGCLQKREEDEMAQQ